MNEDMYVVDFLIELILNNTRLNYNKDDLRINSDDVVLEVIKVLSKEKYENRLQELIEKKKKGEEEI